MLIYVKFIFIKKHFHILALCLTNYLIVMKARKSERFYVYTCHFWQVRVSRKEFYSVIDEILKDQIYAEPSEGVSALAWDYKIPFVVEIFEETLPNGSLHRDYLLSEVYPYSPVGEKGYKTKHYLDNELIEER